MGQATLFEQLKNPRFYGPDVKHVRVMQTHISYVALTGTYAFKVKKPVNFGFLDFSTLEKRKYYCEEEIRLNRRLCPDIYLDVLPITQTGNDFELNGRGTIVDYALKMKEFPQENIMTSLLKQGKITEEILDNIVSLLVTFYKKDKHSAEIDSYGKLVTVKQNIDENFEQTQNVVDVTISKDTYEFLKARTAEFFLKKKDVFDQRIQDGRIHDCHGDLHSGNIVVDNGKIYIFDCIEFNKRFRFCDVASDIGFLAMDLDVQNQPYLSSHLISQYVMKSKDNGIFSVLNFYKSYRAYVRGKVIGFQLSDPTIETAKKQEIITTTKKYFYLSRYYAALFSLDLSPHKPFLFLVSGLSGTGKSTVALKIAVDYHASQINTDIVRKQLAGIDTYEKHHDMFNTGLYDPKNVDVTYEKVMENAAGLLKHKENVVLDATFQKKKYRDMARKIAKDNNAVCIMIQCVCPDTEVKNRLEERVKKKSISDGRWEIYLSQKETYEPFTTHEPYLQIDTANTSYQYRMGFFNTLLSKIQEI